MKKKVFDMNIFACYNIIRQWKEVYIMELGKELKRIIKQEKGLSLSWVAEQIGENEKTFAGWLNLNRISGVNLLKVANVCNLDLNKLKKKLGGETMTELDYDLYFEEVEGKNYLTLLDGNKSNLIKIEFEKNDGEPSYARFDVINDRKILKLKNNIINVEHLSNEDVEIENQFDENEDTDSIEGLKYSLTKKFERTVTIVNKNS